MKRLILLFLLVIMACKNTTELEVYDYEGLKPFLNQQDDKVHVVNFWATWCAPCIKELPYFETINKNYAHKNVEVLLVSLDFPRQYETKLKPFLKEKQLTSKVICFDDTDQNTWIPAIDKKWSGALPATLIYKKGKRKFYEGSFTEEELQTELKLFLN
jgi:thiol-disulfide isomerase/thioredoxin